MTLQAQLAEFVGMEFASIKENRFKAIDTRKLAKRYKQALDDVDEEEICGILVKWKFGNV
jgi:hypothetical protein